MTSYQVMTNREFDGRHNVLSQMSYSYNEKDGDLMEVSEIRSASYSPSGVARQQDIVTFADADRTQILEIKHIENSGIYSNGNVGTSDIKIYKNITNLDALKTGADIMMSGLEEYQHITTSKFDVRGNAIDQEIVKTYYRADGTQLGTKDKQVIHNLDTYTIHDRPLDTTIANYEVSLNADTHLEEEAFTDIQKIHTLASDYDRYGNAEHQTIDTFDDLAMPLTSLVSHKDIVNNYGQPGQMVTILLADGVNTTQKEATFVRKKGNAITSTVVETDKDGALIQRTVTTTSLFDYRGNAVDQSTDKKVLDKVTLSEKLVTTTQIHNSDIDGRGDA